ncbi:serine/threonine-protein kinase [Tahibacter harae]|uniref:Serine/threonine-protein kinase n=1 Tax=Tahibacter harae TaxID=2963937 RepID=A0ABT1QUH7_9GAMM|nr:serine/threonine-protein kinase [Tahibacter harae]MCQ4165945.1 serine/threonine-protein kinase [Tahibacter harae]
MSNERALERLIERLLTGAPGETAQTSPLEGLSAGEAAALDVIGSVFAGYDALRSQPLPAAAPRPEPQEGDRVGPFRLRGRLGAGGMGEVWLAERADGQVEQRVAVKFLRISQQHFAEWFQREQRLLARLEHHYIARFIDAGHDGRGLPWLAMEYVDGEALDSHCDAHGYGLEQRLALFLRVCEAVEHAHRHLVLHRDIKPANILVSRDGTPKLLDFGVGKALGAAADAETRQPAFTFAYGAPEQFRGAPVSTATDVFSLGLLLYHLLAGELPRSRQQASVAELALREQTLEPASAQAQDNPAAPVPAARLRGDLDAILAKATAADPRDRYAAVTALADDLRRFCDGLPVNARPATRRYRARKFVRRHRTGVVAAAVALLALTLGLGLALWQAGEARAQARRADLQAARAERIADFMTGLLREQDPLERPGSRPRSAQELVADGVRRARSDLAEQPELRASLLAVLGEATANLGDLGAAQAVLSQALAEAPAGSAAAARLEALLGRIAIQQGHDGEGVARLDAALPLLLAGSAQDQVFAARLQVYQANDLLQKGRTEPALALMRTSYARVSARLGEDNLDVLDVRESLIGLLEQARRDDEAEPLARDLIARLERLAGADSPQLADALRYLAGIEKRRGNFAAAGALYQRAIALALRHLGARHHATATLYSRYANVLQDAGQPESALAQLALAEQALPDGADKARAQILATRGETLIDLKRADEAEQVLREALRLRREAGGPQDALAWYAQSEWGRALLAQGHMAQAEAAQREALAQMQRIMGADAYQLTFVLRALGDTCMAAGRPAEAAALRGRARELAARRYAAGHIIVLQFRLGQAEALLAAGDAAAALAQLQAILAEPEQPGTQAIRARARELQAAAPHSAGSAAKKSTRR